MPPVPSSLDSFNASVWDDHSDRLRRLEDGLASIVPGIAAVNEAVNQMSKRLETIHEDVGEVKSVLQDRRVADAEQALRLKDLEAAEVEFRAVQTKNAEQELRLKTLEDAEKEHKARRSAILKWGAGVVSSLLIAVLVAFLGLK